MTDCNTKEINQIVMFAMSAIEKNEVKNELDALNMNAQMLRCSTLEFYQIFKLNIVLDLLIEHLESILEIYQQNNFSSEEITSLEKTLSEARKVKWPTPRIVGKRM